MFFCTPMYAPKSSILGLGFLWLLYSWGLTFWSRVCYSASDANKRYSDANYWVAASHGVLLLYVKLIRVGFYLSLVYKRNGSEEFDGCRLKKDGSGKGLPRCVISKKKKCLYLNSSFKVWDVKNNVGHHFCSDIVIWIKVFVQYLYYY